jgi:hypothetical protein
VKKNVSANVKNKKSDERLRPFSHGAADDGHGDAAAGEEEQPH